MKSLKISFLLLAIAASFSSAFIITSIKSSSTYYYICGTGYQRLKPGHTTESNLIERTIISSYFTDEANWTKTPRAFTFTTNASQYIAAISFDEEFTTDGGSDGQLTLQEALNAVYSQYIIPSPFAMQSSYIVGNNAQITVIFSATICD